MQKLIIASSAYERKAELGGGFRGVAIDKRDGQRHESPVLPTVEAARFWVRQTVAKLMDGRPWAPGYCYHPYWTMNVWVREQ